jgi:hypothetical protein
MKPLFVCCKLRLYSATAACGLLADVKVDTLGTTAPYNYLCAPS